MEVPQHGLIFLTLLLKTIATGVVILPTAGLTRCVLTLRMAPQQG